MLPLTISCHVSSPGGGRERQRERVLVYYFYECKSISVICIPQPDPLTLIGTSVPLQLGSPIGTSRLQNRNHVPKTLPAGMKWPLVLSAWKLWSPKLCSQEVKTPDSIPMVQSDNSVKGITTGQSYNSPHLMMTFGFQK